MFNITQVNNRINIDSDNVIFHITGSFVSGTSIIVANIEAEGYSWDVSYSGTMVNVKLITSVPISCARTQLDASFGVPSDYSGLTIMTGKTSLLAGSDIDGFACQGDYVYCAALNSMKRILISDGTVETKSYSIQDLRNFILASKGQTIVETYDADYNYEVLLKDFEDALNDKVLYTISGLIDSYSYKTFCNMCMMPDGKIITFLYTDHTGEGGNWIIEVQIHQFPAGTHILTWTISVTPNFNIQPWPAPPVIAGDKVFWGIGWLANSTAGNADTGIIVMVDPKNLNVSYIRPMNGAHASGAIYCGAYDATLGCAAFIFDSVVGLSGAREAGIFLVEGNMEYSIVHSQAYTYPTYVANVPQGLIQGKDEAFVLHHDGGIESLSSAHGTTVTGGLTNMAYAMPRFCSNMVDSNSYIWAVDGSGGSLTGHSVLGYVDIGSGVSFTGGNLYLYLTNKKLFVRNATAGTYNLWVMT